MMVPPAIRVSVFKIRVVLLAGVPSRSVGLRKSTQHRLFHARRPKIRIAVSQSLHLTRIDIGYTILRAIQY